MATQIPINNVNCNDEFEEWLQSVGLMDYKRDLMKIDIISKDVIRQCKREQFLTTIKQNIKYKNILNDPKLFAIAYDSLTPKSPR